MKFMQNERKYDLKQIAQYLINKKLINKPFRTWDRLSIEMFCDTVHRCTFKRDCDKYFNRTTGKYEDKVVFGDKYIDIYDI